MSLSVQPDDLGDEASAFDRLAADIDDVVAHLRQPCEQRSGPNSRRAGFEMSEDVRVGGTEEVSDLRWFAARLVFQHPDRGVYEERIVIWQTENFETAVALAESEGDGYAASVAAVRLGLVQVYEMFDPPVSGGEVFSLMRESELGPGDYTDRFFDTGSERQRHIEPGAD